MISRGGNLPREGVCTSPQSAGEQEEKKCVSQAEKHARGQPKGLVDWPCLIQLSHWGSVAEQ